MLRKLIVIAALASLALLPNWASAQEQVQVDATATGDASTNTWFFSSDTCSLDPQSLTWADQGGGSFTASGGVTPTEGTVDQEFDAVGTEAFGEVYFDGGSEAWQVGFSGRLRCLSETEALVSGTWDWGFAYEFGGEVGDICTELIGNGRVSMRVNFADQTTSTEVIGSFTKGEAVPCGDR